MSQDAVHRGPTSNPPDPSRSAVQPDRRYSFGFALWRGKKPSTDEEGTQAKTTESRTQTMRGLDTGFFLPEEAWRSDNIDRLNRTTLPTDMTPPFRRYERTLTLRYLEEDVSTLSNEEYLSSQTLSKLRLVLGWLALLAPLPLLMQPAPAFHCLYVVVTTSLLWILRPVPLCVAALFPVVALPLIGVLSTETVCGLYFNESILLCLSSSLMAALAQRQGLQRWLTVTCLRCLGGSLRCLLFSLMSTTALCAMLLSAPAAAYGAIPLAETLAKEFQRKPPQTSPAVAAVGQVNDPDPNPGFGGQSVDDFSMGEERADSVRKVLLIAVVLSAIMSAPACLTGASANMFLKGFLEIEGYHSMVTFSNWVTANAICAAANIMGLWLFFVFLYVRKIERQEPGFQETVSNAVRAVISTGTEHVKPREGVVIVIYAAVVLIVYFEWSDYGLGLAKFLGLTKWIDETTPFVTSLILVLIILPSVTSSGYDRIAFWSEIEMAIPWSTLLVMGSGFALTKAMQKTSLVSFLSSSVPTRPQLSLNFLQVVLCIVVSIAAELRGGVALCCVVSPFVLKLCKSFHWHPLSLLIPVTLCCSMGLFFSVSSPANNLLMAKERINLSNLAVSGLFAHLIFVTTAITMTNSVAPTVFNITAQPMRANP
ncbi:solute carrier family 13 member 3-like [Rhipicephalus sanguineus]|uniref:solute carrier family 13 member 3-like n=1 Tax=Rhipicephalus sanguineus TaxID=34632 RepID=UPI0018952220|nr:solute carrier family 13 member 3-like [Rhipicephalus sanguineus]